MTRIWLTVYELHDGPGYGYPSQLWWRDVELAHAPNIGESMFFLTSDEDPEGAVDTEVGLRYWAFDGQMNLQLRPIVHLPNDLMEKRINGYVRIEGDRYYRTCPMPWRVDDDENGLLDDRLRASGWRTWAELNVYGQ